MIEKYVYFTDEETTEIRIRLTSSETSNVGVVLIATETDDAKLEFKIDYDAFDYVDINRFIFRFEYVKIILKETVENIAPIVFKMFFFSIFLKRLPSTSDERIWGGGEQFTFLNLRKGGNYPLWVREQVSCSRMDKNEICFLYIRFQVD
jgi:hypothetical protein